MDKVDFKNAASETSQYPRQSKEYPKQCAVNGCPRIGTIFTANWNCRYHHGRPGRLLAYITTVLRNHKTEFDWYDTLLTMNGVDFAVGDVHKKAPYMFEVQEGENWLDYRDRVRAHIKNLLAEKEE